MPKPISTTMGFFSRNSAFRSRGAPVKGTRYFDPNRSIARRWASVILPDLRTKVRMLPSSVHRLADEVEGAGLERLHRQFDIAEGGDHGHRRTGEIARDLLDQLDAIAVGQAHVGEAQVVGVAGQQLAGFADIGGGVDPKAHATQGQGQQLSDVAFVIDDQGATGVAHHGLALRATQSTCWMCPRGRFAAAVGRVLTRRP